MATNNPSDPHAALMAGDVGGVPDRRVTRRPPKPPKPPDPPSPDRDAGQLWQERLERANKVYTRWAEDYECKHLDDYYEGRQWRGVEEDAAKKKYTLNLVFATVETQLPSLLFSSPDVEVEPRPSHEWTEASHVGARATLIEQTLQTFIDDPKVRFGFETTLALRDAYPRFGIVEVGYTADWIDNPNADRPILKENGTPMLDVDDTTGEARPIGQPKRILQPGTQESLYVRRIDPATVRVSPGHNALLANDWVAYYEWQYLEDVKRNRDYRHTEDLKGGGSLVPVDDAEHERNADEDAAARSGQIKIWKIWDLRTKRRLVYAEGHPKLLQRKPFAFCPLAVLKFYERRNAFYPLPPIYNWMSPQDAINEDRQMQRVHRRRAVRRYMYEPSVQKTEIEKLETTEDMAAIEVPKVVPPPIVPIQDAPLDLQNWTDLAAAREDFNQISGVAGEARSTPSAPTATQANIMNVRTQIRESHAREQVAGWLGEIARLILLTLREKMKLPFMVKIAVDPFALVQALQQDGDPQALLQAAETWQEITVEDIAALDVDISVDITTMSPVAKEQQGQAYLQYLQLLTNPALQGLIFTPIPGHPDEPSPMFRKLSTSMHITSDQEIRYGWQVGQQLRQDMQQAAQAQAALAAQPQPPKVNVTLKAEDILMTLGPIEGPAYLKMLLEPNASQQAAQIAQPQPPIMTAGPGRGGLSIPAPPKTTTGMPARPM